MLTGERCIIVDSTRRGKRTFIVFVGVENLLNFRRNARCAQ